MLFSQRGLAAVHAIMPALGRKGGVGRCAVGVQRSDLLGAVILEDADDQAVLGEGAEGVREDLVVLEGLDVHVRLLASLAPPLGGDDVWSDSGQGRGEVLYMVDRRVVPA